MSRDMTPNDIMQSMRLMEWERAKGHLYAMLQTYWPNSATSEDGDFEKINNLVEEFIKEVNDTIG